MHMAFCLTLVQERCKAYSVSLFPVGCPQHRPSLAVSVEGPVAVVGDRVEVQPTTAHHVVGVPLGTVVLDIYQESESLD